MRYQVSDAAVAPRQTAVIAATTTWEEFPALWKELLDEVWACLHAGGIRKGCRNIMLYRDDVPHVEVGVLLDQPCALTGRVAASVLPGANVATAVHWGPYGGLRLAHEAILDWCRSAQRAPARARWEIYGPHNDDSAQIWTEVHYLLHD